MLPQGVSTNQILGSYVNWTASKQNLSSGFPTKWYSNQPAKLQRPARKLKFRFSKSRYEKKVLYNSIYIICTHNFVFPKFHCLFPCSPEKWHLFPCSLEINGLVPLFSKTPGRASYMILFIKRIAKALIRLRICAGWFAPLVFVNPRARRQVFSRRGPYNIWFMLLHLRAELTCKGFESRYEGLCNYFVSSNGHQGNRLVSEALADCIIDNNWKFQWMWRKTSKDIKYQTV